MSRQGTVLVVDSGCHRGVRKTLDGTELTVGGALEDDLVLFGDRLEPRHLVLAGEGGRRFRVHANAPAVVNGAPLAAGEALVVTLPASIEANGVRLSWQAPQGEGRVPVRLGAVALALTASALVAWSLPEEAAEESAVALLAPAPETAAPAARPAPGTATAAAELARLADEAGLSVAVEGGPRQVTAHGTVTPDEEAAWSRVQVAFDARFGGSVPLVNLVTVKAPAPPELPPIEAVWQGEGPYVVVRGRKYHVGTAIGGEWQVEEIGTDAVTLRHAAAGEITIGF